MNLPLCFIILTVLIMGCNSNANEPDNQLIQQNFQQHFSRYEELLKMFRADSAESNVSFVSAEDPSRTRCNLSPSKNSCSLNIGRWKKYQNLLRQSGVLWIEHNSPTDPYYFVTYYEPMLMNARLKGVVFSEEKYPQDSAYHSNQQGWPIQNGWHVFLIVDG
ncbi:hypothetical protein [Methylosoma difficile]